ncbi:MAG: hypothetical protein FJ279_21210, partial [Planctomycetes bacterium]|nr:hypothetical protein [Planctomycetota bacterium]
MSNGFRTWLLWGFLFSSLALGPTSICQVPDRAQRARLGDCLKGCVNSLGGEAGPCPLLAELATKHGDDPRVLLYVAKMNELHGRYGDALSALDVLRGFPPDRMSPGLTAPVALVATFYKARLLSEQREPQQAIETYLQCLAQATTPEWKERVRVQANMYLAEVSATSGADKGRAIEYLKQAAAPVTIVPSAGWKEGFTVYGKWAECLLREARGDARLPRMESSYAQTKLNYALVLAFGHLAIGGVAMQLDLDLGADHAHVLAGILMEHDLKRAARSAWSGTNRTAAQLVLGNGYERKGDFDQGRAAYAQLANTYFAPEGAILSAGCLYKMGKKSEGGKALDEVRKKFPAYKQALKPIQDLWEKGLSDRERADEAPKSASRTSSSGVAHAPVQKRVNPVDGAETVWIPDGTFMMGSDKGTIVEKPVHEQRVQGFWMYTKEVTNAQFRKFLEAKPQWSPDQIPRLYHDRHYLKHWRDEKCMISKDDEYPVVYMSWYAAKAYAEWAGGRLPTEVEWEYAARDGKQWEYGTATGKLARDLANYSGTGGKD